MCDFGEGRLYTTYKVVDAFKYVHKCQFFNPLPPDLSTFDTWFPSFRIADGIGAPVNVLLTFKPDTNLVDAEEWKMAQKNLPHKWFTTILIPAIESLDGSRRTRLNNTVSTMCMSGIIPDYIRIYKEDLTSLDDAISEATQSSEDMKSLLWYFASWKFGQQMRLTITKQ